LFRCTPPEMAERALETIRGHPKVAKASLIDDMGAVSVLMKGRLQTWSTVFDSHEWTMTRVGVRQAPVEPPTSAPDAGVPMETPIRGDVRHKQTGTGSQSERVYEHNPNSQLGNATVPMCAQDTLKAMPGVTEEFIKDLRMTKEEEANIPFLAWYYGQLGLNLFDTNFGEKAAFFMFTVDMMYHLGYYSDIRNPSAILNKIPEKEGAIIKMGYADAFGRSHLLAGEGIIVNPLRTRPSGDRVVFIHETHLLDVLSRFISPKAKALNSLICRFVSLAMRTSARTAALASGKAKFSAAVAEPATEMLQWALNDERMKRLEAEKKFLEAQNQVKDAENKFLQAQNEAKDAEKNTLKALKKAADYRTEAETAKRLALEHKSANHPLPTRHNSSSNTPRTGCATVYMKKLGADRVEVSMHFTDMRSMGSRRRTLKSCAYVLPHVKEGKIAILKLYGGTRMIDLRSNFDDAFNVIGCPAVQLRDEEEVWSHLNGLFMDRARSGFAMGVTWSGGKKQLAFINELVISGMPDEDVDFCRGVQATIPE